MTFLDGSGSVKVIELTDISTTPRLLLSNFRCSAVQCFADPGHPRLQLQPRIARLANEAQIAGSSFAFQMIPGPEPVPGSTFWLTTTHLLLRTLIRDEWRNPNSLVCLKQCVSQRRR